MADPSIQTFCCHQVDKESPSQSFLLEFNSSSYHKVCLASSLIGILGAVYQILPRKQPQYQNHRFYALSFCRGRYIVVWLATADLLASVGVFIRSLFWLNRQSFPIKDDTLTILCAVSAAWIQYFYTATWLWTLIYAIDMKLLIREIKGKPRWYHLIVWSVPAVLTAVGLSILYIPDANCHDIDNSSSAFLRVFPNYCAVYVPMAVVMVVNPILYFSLSSEMEPLIARSLSQFTNKERHMMDLIRMKSAFINLTFYACWMPNLINGILLWSLWYNLPHKSILILWYIMALMNPLQALFNSLVYRKWSGGGEKISLPFYKYLRRLGLPKKKFTKSYLSESTPLIAPSSINNSTTDESEIKQF